MNRLIAVSMLCVMALCTVASAQDDADSRVSVDVGVDFTNVYAFRGYVHEDHGFIAQPSVDLNVCLFENEGPVESVVLTLGTWSSFHSGNTGTGSGNAEPRAWYEADGYATLTAEIEDFEVGLTWITYSSPNNSFDTTNEWILSFGWDDSEMWGDFGGLQPSLIIAIEDRGQLDGGRDSGTFLGLSIDPSLPVGDDLPFSLSVPVTLGLSLKDYYEDPRGHDKSFGFLDIGIDLDMPIECVTSAYGEWTFTAGIHGLFLGDTTDEANDGDDFELICSIGVGLSF
jgi:hypothetical protein